MQVIKIDEFDASGLVHPINLILGEELIGVELGTFRAVSAVGLIQNCPKIKKIYTIDFYKPYEDHIKNMGRIPMPYTEIESEVNKFYANLHIKYSGVTDKIKLLEEDTEVSVKKFYDNFFDFIFFDGHLTQEQLQRDLNSWYSKCKSGGLICVHDWDCPYVQNAVNLFRHEMDIKSKVSIFDDSIIWVKE